MGIFSLPQWSRRGLGYDGTTEVLDLGRCQLSDFYLRLISLLLWALVFFYDQILIPAPSVCNSCLFVEPTWSVFNKDTKESIKADSYTPVRTYQDPIAYSQNIFLVPHSCLCLHSLLYLAHFLPDELLVIASHLLQEPFSSYSPLLRHRLG